MPRRGAGRGAATRLREPYGVDRSRVRRGGSWLASARARSDHRRCRVRRVPRRGPARRPTGTSRSCSTRCSRRPTATTAAGDRAARAGPRRRPRRRPAGPAAARGRRGVPPGGDGRARRRPRRRARLRRAQRPRHRRPARRDARRRGAPAGAGRLDGGLRRGPLRLPGARRRAARAAGARPTSTRAGSSRAARAAAATWSPGSSARTRRSTRAAPTPPPRSPRSTWSAAWARQTGGAAWRCATTTSTGRGCRATPRTPASPSIFRSALERGRGAAGLRGRRPAARLRARHRRRRGQRARADDRPARGRPHRGQRLLRASRTRSATWPARSPRRPAGPAPVVVGGARPGDVRHVVADPARAAVAAGVPGRGGLRRRACAPSPPIRCALRPGRPTSPNGKRAGTRPRGRPRPEDRGVDGDPEIILPCLDEADALPVVLAALPAGWPVLVVDNGSTDGTADGRPRARRPGRHRAAARVRRRGARRAGGGAGRARRGARRGRLDRPRRAARRWPPRSPAATADLAVGRRVPQAPRRLAVARPRRQRRDRRAAAAPRACRCTTSRPIRVARRAALLELGVADRALRLPAGAAAARRRGGMADRRGPGGLPAAGRRAGRRSPARVRGTRPGDPGHGGAAAVTRAGRWALLVPRQGARSPGGSRPGCARRWTPPRRPTSPRPRCWTRSTRCAPCPAAACVVALAGRLSAAARAGELAAALRGVATRRQRGPDLGHRIAAAHRDAAGLLPGRPVLQLGMDTPQVEPGPAHRGRRAAAPRHRRRGRSARPPTAAGGRWGCATRGPPRRSPTSRPRATTRGSGPSTRCGPRGCGWGCCPSSPTSTRPPTRRPSRGSRRGPASPRPSPGCRPCPPSAVPRSGAPGAEPAGAAVRAESAGDRAARRPRRLVDHVRAFDPALAGAPARLVRDDGVEVDLAVRAVAARPRDGEDRWLLDRCTGPAIDLGCGPGTPRGRAGGAGRAGAGGGPLRGRAAAVPAAPHADGPPGRLRPAAGRGHLGPRAARRRQHRHRRRPAAPAAPGRRGCSGPAGACWWRPTPRPTCCGAAPSGCAPPPGTGAPLPWACAGADALVRLGATLGLRRTACYRGVRSFVELTASGPASAPGAAAAG